MNLRQIINSIVAKGDNYNRDLIVEWINDGYMGLARVAKIPATAEIVTNPELDIQLWELPENLVSIQSRARSDKNEWLDRINEEQIDDAVGVPSAFFMRGNMVGFYPHPDRAFTAYMSYYKYPEKLVDDTDLVDDGIPEHYHSAIINFGIAKAKEQVEDYSAASYYMGLFEQAKNQLEKTRNWQRSRRVKARVWI